MAAIRESFAVIHLAYLETLRIPPPQECHQAALHQHVRSVNKFRPNGVSQLNHCKLPHRKKNRIPWYLVSNSGLTQLFHEKSELLMMATNRLRVDLTSANNSIVGLVLCVIS